MIHSRPGVKLDERSAALIMMKCLPLGQLIQMLYPDMYKVDNLELAKTKEDEEGQLIPVPGRLQLSAEHVTLNGAFLMDCGDKMLLSLGKVVPPFFCEKVNLALIFRTYASLHISFFYRCLELVSLWMSMKI